LLEVLNRTRGDVPLTLPVGHNRPEVDSIDPDSVRSESLGEQVYEARNCCAGCAHRSHVMVWRVRRNAIDNDHCWVIRTDKIGAGCVDYVHDAMEFDRELGIELINGGLEDPTHRASPRVCHHRIQPTEVPHHSGNISAHGLAVFDVAGPE
jgi:hypothetical protein